MNGSNKLVPRVGEWADGQMGGWMGERVEKMISKK